MHQPCPSSGQSAGPLRPAAPAPVLTAVKLMYGGAAVTAVELVFGLALIIVGINAAARGRFLGHSLTSPQARPVVITVWVLGGLVVTALWLWMARANGQGRNWARIASTVLSGLAAVQLIGGFRQPVTHVAPGLQVLGLLGAALALLPGLAAVWLLWRPASSAFFT